ncbi:alkaline phosphatase family protein [Streptacidiphilus sp. ASG 303]|uniref:alkaline phosphatase D family protein n=1 Tax=Streptacidiphilus sp. ASG 303 TaxID=2896847 RepID=UPI001E50C2D2|nr:alkaline phosphatase D family protein [Streptacidiphilus sp. ASG 303]MCD0483986.1 alkaline phosphatase family protein [Streptacidiphilus sp. ASG 303]
MPGLVLGPLLRYVDRDSATVWVETAGPCEVAVRTDGAAGPGEGPGAGGAAGPEGTAGPEEAAGQRARTGGAAAGAVTATARTWEVAGHHYALAVLRGLRPGTTSTYRVELDGVQVWPPEDSALPPSRIRTLPPEGADRPLRLSFGSCRWASPPSTDGSRLDPDALDTLAQRLAARPDTADWPDGLLLLGDQVYADETSEPTQAWLAGRRDLAKPPHGQVADFEEYTHLYYESWLDPDIRWLLSTVPSCMIFDDHDIVDDWNTSASWRRDMAATDWWAERVTSGLASYWIYQHLGNLAPDDLEADELYAAVRSHTGDCAELVRAHARRADGEADLPDEEGAKGRVRWSYRRDFGRTRLLMIDSRAGRVLTEGDRGMVGREELDWIAEQAADGECDHLLVGASLPWLLPPAVHDVESWNEALCAGVRGPWWAARSEPLRRAGDLEHWAAFRRSFDALADLLLERADAPDGPASVCVLSGDVHHAYLAEAFPRSGPAPRARLLQLTCSPVHNSVPTPIRLAFRFGWSRTARRIGALLARHGRLAPTPVRWDRLAGPYFGNQVMTLSLRGRSGRLLLERARRGEGGEPRLERVTAADIGEPIGGPEPDGGRGADGGR